MCHNTRTGYLLLKLITLTNILLTKMQLLTTFYQEQKMKLSIKIINVKYHDNHTSALLEPEGVWIIEVPDEQGPDKQGFTVLYTLLIHVHTATAIHLLMLQQLVVMKQSDGQMHTDIA